MNTQFPGVMADAELRPRTGRVPVKSKTSRPFPRLVCLSVATVAVLAAVGRLVCV